MKTPVGFCSLVIIVAISVVLLSLSRVEALSLEELLQMHLKSNYPWAEVGIDKVVVSENFPGDVPRKIRIEKGPPGSTVFVLDLSDGRKITASAMVKAFDWVVISTRAFRKGYALQKEDVYAVMMDVTKIPKGALKDIEGAIGKPLGRPIAANAAITDAIISEAALIKKGHRITLLVESPRFSIKTYGEMRENGRVGNYVKVMNQSSKKIITGLLIDEGTVKVEF